MARGGGGGALNRAPSDRGIRDGVLRRGVRLVSTPRSAILRCYVLRVIGGFGLLEVAAFCLISYLLVSSPFVGPAVARLRFFIFALGVGLFCAVFWFPV